MYWWNRWKLHRDKEGNCNRSQIYFNKNTKSPPPHIELTLRILWWRHHRRLFRRSSRYYLLYWSVIDDPILVLGIGRFEMLVILPGSGYLAVTELYFQVVRLGNITWSHLSWMKGMWINLAPWIMASAASPSTKTHKYTSEQGLQAV